MFYTDGQYWLWKAMWSFAELTYAIWPSVSLELDISILNSVCKTHLQNHFLFTLCIQLFSQQNLIQHSAGQDTFESSHDQLLMTIITLGQWNTVAIVMSFLLTAVCAIWYFKAYRDPRHICILNSHTRNTGILIIHEQCRIYVYI